MSSSGDFWLAWVLALLRSRQVVYCSMAFIFVLIAIPGRKRRNIRANDCARPKIKVITLDWKLVVQMECVQQTG